MFLKSEIWTMVVQVVHDSICLNSYRITEHILVVRTIIRPTCLK